MGSALWADPRSKYVVPSVVIVALSMVIYVISYSTISSQLRAYTSNRSRVVDEWVKEGMKSYNLDDSIEYLNEDLREAETDVLQNVLWGGFGMVVASLTENSMLDNKYRVIDVLEYLFLFYSEYWGAVQCMETLVDFGVLYVLSVILAMGVFFHFTNKKIRPQGQMLYGVFVLEMLTATTSYFCYNPLKHDRNLGTRFVDSKDIKQGLKDRAVKLAARYGVGPDSIFIDKTLPGINAASDSGPGYKVVMLSPKMILATTDDQLMAVISHELGHIVNGDSIAVGRILLASSAVKYLCSAAVYGMMSGYCNGFTGLVSVVYVNRCFNYVSRRLRNYYIYHDDEFRADYEAFKNGYGKAYLGYRKLVGGAFFDYTKYYGMNRTHPSGLQRIKVLRKHMQQ